MPADNQKLPVVISTTSWKARINTVGKTIYSIAKICNPEKICLTLSSKEFPGKENDLPESLQVLAAQDILEIIWTVEDVKCFKKILFAMWRYKSFPIVSADDDCLYLKNYAKVLYDHWLTDKSSIWTFKLYKAGGRNYVHGPAALYPPNCFEDYGLIFIKDKNILNTWHDDVYYSVLAWKLGINIRAVKNDQEQIYKFHDCAEPLHSKFTCGVCQATEICMRKIR